MSSRLSIIQDHEPINITYIAINISCPLQICKLNMNMAINTKPAIQNPRSTVVYDEIYTLSGQNSSLATQHL
jgi:hypothetical protein